MEYRDQSESSHLLALPPEIRLNIYEYLRGGRTIHIRHPIHSNLEIRHCVCERFDTDFQSSDRQRLSKTSGYRHEHEHCRRDLFPSNGLNLLLVCRHIYVEAALTSFQDNLFAFMAPSDITEFLNLLTPRQQQSITHVLLYETNHRRAWSKPLEPDIARRLTGLSHLFLYLETCILDLTGSNAYPSLHDPGALEQVFAGIRALKAEHLRAVKVKVVDDTDPRLRDPRRRLIGSTTPMVQALPQDRVKRWAARAEEAMMAVPMRV